MRCKSILMVFIINKLARHKRNFLHKSYNKAVIAVLLGLTRCAWAQDAPLPSYDGEETQALSSIILPVDEQGMGGSSSEEGTQPNAPPLTVSDDDGLSYWSNFRNTMHLVGSQIRVHAPIPADPHMAVGPSHMVTVVNSSIRITLLSDGTVLDDRRLGELPANATGIVDTFTGELKDSLDRPWEVSLDVNSLENSFFDELDPANFLFDPRVIYDRLSQRFFVVALERVDPNSGVSPPIQANSRILLAVSNTSDPTQGWQFRAISGLLPYTEGGNTIQTWADFPDIGVDDHAIYITNNQFTFAPRVFRGPAVWVIGKAALFANPVSASVNLVYPAGPLNSATANASGNLRVATTMPNSEIDPVNGGVFLVAFQNWGAGAPLDERLRCYRISNPLTNPTVTQTLDYQCNNFHDGGLFASQTVPQMNERNIAVANLEAGDTRLQNAVIRFEPNSATTTADDVWQIYTVNTIKGAGWGGSGANVGQATVMWYRLDLANTAGTWSMALGDAGQVGGDATAASLHTYYPSIAVDDYGNVGLSLCGSSDSTFSSAYYTGRKPSDPAGQMQPLGTLKHGAGSYQIIQSGTTRNRWGDYSAICVDPEDGSTFWCYNNYAGQNAPVDIAVPYDLTKAFWQTAYGSFNVREAVRQNDLNNDGFTDLALQYSLSGSSSTGRMDIMFLNGLNQILRTKTTPTTSGTTLSLGALGDIDGNSTTDFIFRSSSTYKFRMWTMNGSARVATITPTPDPVMSSTTSLLLAGRFDSDSGIDVLVRNSTTGRHYVHRFGTVTINPNGTTGTIQYLGYTEITPPPSVTYPSTSTAIRSVSPIVLPNGDRYFFAQNTTTGACNVWVGQWNAVSGKLAFSSSSPLSTSSPASQISGSANVIRGADDVDNDGVVDLIIQNGTNIRIKKGIGPLSFGAYLSFSPSTLSLNWTIRNN